MHNSDQITIQLPYLQDQKLFMLRWRSVEIIVHWSSAAIDNCLHHDLYLVVVFLTDWDLALSQSWAQ